MTAWSIHHGDVFERLPELEAGSFDAVLCDPPYGLKFMGKAWDHGVPGEPVWSLVREALKPGAHLLAFGGTRTEHRLVCATEDAGFEIRDKVMWLYGSGFPKSLAIDKAIDKCNGQCDRLHKFTAWMRTTGLTAKQINEATGTFMGSHYLTSGSQPAIPTPALWARLRPLCGDVPAWVDELVERIEAEREVVGRSSNQCGVGWAESGSAGYAPEFDITTPATDLAKRFHGYGTALKPAYEPCVVAMKPLDGTFAANAAAHGVAGLWIDGGRVSHSEPCRMMKPSQANIDSPSEKCRQAGRRNAVLELKPEGRWPANLILDAEAAAMLDAQSGNRPGMPRTTKRSGASAKGYGIGDRIIDGAAISPGYGDTGGASRFFYTAKASTRERNAGLEDGVNRHPTLKPIDLCRYLATLILSPKRDTPRRLLVPFSGSGSEMIGALLAGWDEVVGIEREREYIDIAERRLAHWCASSPARRTPPPGPPPRVPATAFADSLFEAVA